MERNSLILSILLVGLTSSILCSEERVVEHYKSGAVKWKYSVDDDKNRHGRFTEFFESGERKKVFNYQHGKRRGKCTDFYRNGKKRIERQYKNGRVTGQLKKYNDKGEVVHKVVYRSDKIFLSLVPQAKKPIEVHPRSRKDIERNISELRPRGFEGEKFLVKPATKAPYVAGNLDPAYIDEGLRQLNVYRYLCGLDHDVTIDEGRVHDAQHAAIICAAHNKLDHHPPQPGDMDPEFFETAYRGAKNSNLHQQQASLVRAIDGFMDDSDPTNIDVLGHRAWCLNPGFKKTGFGEAAGFVAQWAVDGGTGKRPGHILYPASGYFPIDYFGRSYAWSIASSSALPDKSEVEVRVWTLDKYYSAKREFELDYLGVRQKTDGMGAAIIFRPVFKPEEKLWDLPVQVAARWWKGTKREARVDYVVDLGLPQNLWVVSTS